VTVSINTDDKCRRAVYVRILWPVTVQMQKMPVRREIMTETTDIHDYPLHCRSSPRSTDDLPHDKTDYFVVITQYAQCLLYLYLQATWQAAQCWDLTTVQPNAHHQKTPM